MEGGAEVMSLYEGMYVLKPTLTEGERQEALAALQKGIEEQGGEVVKVHDQQRRKLAYDIQGYHEGFYYILYFRLPGYAVKALWNDYRIMEHLLRYTTLRAACVMEKIEFKSLIEETM